MNGTSGKEQKTYWLNRDLLREKERERESVLQKHFYSLVDQIHFEDGFLNILPLPFDGTHFAISKIGPYFNQDSKTISEDFPVPNSCLPLGWGWILLIMIKDPVHGAGTLFVSIILAFVPHLVVMSKPDGIPSNLQKAKSSTCLLLLLCHILFDTRLHQQRTQNMEHRRRKSTRTIGGTIPIWPHRKSIYS